MKKRAVHAVFFGSVLLILFAGLIRTVFFPKDINNYENRYANKISPFSLTSYLNGSFQDSVESGLTDQVLSAQYFKRFYNLLSSSYTHTFLNCLGDSLNERYVTLGDKTLYNNYIVYGSSSLSSLSPALDAKAENYSSVCASLPDVDFYLYYIERDSDINFVTGEKSGVYEYLASKLALPDGHIGRFKIDSFDDYSEKFYATDHHWNYAGSYLGYTEVLSILLPEEKPLVPEQELLLGTYSGSKATGMNGETYSEAFYVYRFDFPEMSVRINGETVSDYGTQTELENRVTPVGYVSYYGSDGREIEFDTDNTENGNLLIIGESNDNAIIKLLSSHFGKTFSVDLRYYEEGSFSVRDFVDENNVGKVLFIGNSDFYSGNVFLLG